MNTIRRVSPELMPPTAIDPEREAEKHPRLVEGAPHWSTSGWDTSASCPVVILTYDPECPACQKIRRPI